MKAVVYEKFGSPIDVLRVKEVNLPTPKDDEVLIQVHAVSLNPYDWRHIKADPRLIRFMGAGILKPKQSILGADVAGRVEAAGKSVRQFRAGDEVFGEIGYGGLAEYACGAERNLALKPKNLSFEEAAAAPMAALTALQGLRDEGKLRSGQHVLIIGAAGGIGSFAVQIARAMGAEVTGVCRTSKTELVRELGAVRVIDYTQEDVTRLAQQYDLIFDTAAFRSITDYKRILRPGGRYVIAGGTMSRVYQAMLLSAVKPKVYGNFVARVVQEDLLAIKMMLESGKVRSVIDRTYPLHETGAALRYLEQGHARGKVVVVTEAIGL